MATTGPPRWPGATTFPNTNEYPGQGNVPFIRCLISFDDYTAATRSWTDMSARLRSWQVSRGRANELQDFDAGSASIVLENRDRQLDPAINDGIRPMNKIWLYEEFSGERRDLFVGYAEAYVQAWPDGGWSNALTTVRAVDEFKVMARSNLASGTVFSSATAGSILAGPRIGYALDLAVSNPPRLLDAGQTGLATYTLSSDTPVASIITQLAATDIAASGSGAALFIDASGRVRFYDAAHRGGLSTSAVFDDDGTDLLYSDLVIDYSDAFLFNSVTVSDGSSSNSASDSTSIARYGKRSYSVTVLPLSSTPLGSAAGQFVAIYKNPVQRVVQIEPDMGDLETMRVCFNLELLDKIEVFRTPPGGGARVDQVSYIQSINWEGESGMLPSCTLGVSPL